jgi:hypothetical protein
VVIACGDDTSDGVDVSGIASCGPFDDISLVDIRGCVIPGIGVTTVVAAPRVTDSSVSSSAIADTGVLGCHPDPCDAAVVVVPVPHGCSRGIAVVTAAFAWLDCPCGAAVTVVSVPHGCSRGVAVVTAALAWLACPSGAAVTVTPAWLSSSFFVSIAAAFACVCSPEGINTAAASSWGC